MVNVLENFALKRYPIIVYTKNIMSDLCQSAGISNCVMMSGSGPTVFGLFMSPARAEEAYEEMRYGSAASMARQVYLTRVYNRNKDADIRQGNERNGK